MRKLFCIIVIALAATGSAFAWEFDMTGNMSWEYKLYSQMGDKGFFGRFNIDNSPAGNFAGLNGWLGNEILGPRLTTGADASASTMYMTINPEIRLHEALRIRGSYYIGSWSPIVVADFNPNPPVIPTIGVGTFNAPEYFNSTIDGVQSSFSPGYWNTLWVTAQLPWGQLVYGKRPFAFGTGLLLDGTDNTSYEALLLVAPYGPFRFGGAWFPWRAATTGTNGSPLVYPALADKNNAREVHVAGFVTYDSGPVSMGILNEYVKYHLGPESRLTTIERLAFIPQDGVVLDGTAFIKYNNGRFFFNAEAAYVDATFRNTRNSTGIDPAFGQFPIVQTRSSFAPTYIEHWRYMTEFGFLCGPSKLTFLGAYVPGIDRRAGEYIDRQADTRALTQISNYSVFRPYSILFGWNYGSGNNSLTARNGIGSDNGYVTDAVVYAGRLDYAVAANLNVYGSFLWADRISKTYPWGYIRPQELGFPGSGIPTGNISYVNIQGGVIGAASAPSIPDSNLGWEVDGGFDWQLLEGYTLKAAFGYWQPGRWFNFAAIDRGNPGWLTPGPGNLWGINPDRKIDPVFGMDFIMSVDF